METMDGQNETEHCTHHRRHQPSAVPAFASRNAAPESKTTRTFVNRLNQWKSGRHSFCTVTDYARYHQQGPAVQAVRCCCGGEARRFADATSSVSFVASAQIITALKPDRHALLRSSARGWKKTVVFDWRKSVHHGAEPIPSSADAQLRAVRRPEERRNNEAGQKQIWGLTERKPWTALRRPDARFPRNSITAARRCA